jgi:hypothetical protein
MEEVCDFIAKKWNDGFCCEYFEQTSNDELKMSNSNEDIIEYIISQLNIFFGEEVYEIVSCEDYVSFKYKEVKVSIHESNHSRGYAYWVVKIE